MTLSSSLLATVAIPALSKLYLSGVVAVDAGGLAASTAKQVLAPLVAGVVVKACASRVVGAVEPALSIVGIVALVIIVLGTTSLSAELIKASWSSTLAPVALFHIIGFWFGFGVARLLFRMRRPVATAVAFESGFKSPALSFVLARRHFADVEVQTASAVSILVLVPLAMGAAVAFHLWYVLPVGVEETRPVCERCGCVLLLSALFSRECTCPFAPRRQATDTGTPCELVFHPTSCLFPHFAARRRTVWAQMSPATWTARPTAPRAAPRWTRRTACPTCRRWSCPRPRRRRPRQRRPWPARPPCRSGRSPQTGRQRPRRTRG